MWKALYRNLRHKARTERELAGEMHAVLDLLIDEKIRAGLDPATARREARMELGGVEQVKEQVREVRRGRWLENLAQDIRISARTLLAQKSFTAFAVLMLMLGIGATTAIFSVFYSVVLAPLPFRDIDRLVQVRETRLDRGWTQASFTHANFWDVRQLNRSFSEMAGIGWADSIVTAPAGPVHVLRGEVSAGFFRVLGVAPAQGRDFTYQEDQPGENNQVALLSDRLWRSSFAANPNIVGTTVRVSGRLFTVIGVLPPGKSWLRTAQLFTPMVYQANADRGSFELGVIARLKPGVTVKSAETDLAGVSARIASTFPEAKGMGVSLSPASEWGSNRQTRLSMWVLLGGVGLLLLIACVNLANLLLARAAGRKREMAVRSALGASRARLAALALTESCLLSVTGAALGLLLASLSIDALKASLADVVPQLADAELNGYVLGFALALSLLTGMLSGLAPALLAPSAGLALNQAGRSQSGGGARGGRGQTRLRGLLVAGEVALSLMLLVGAGLLIRSFVQLTGVERGFDTQNRLFFCVAEAGSASPSKTPPWPAFSQYLERLRALPYVKAAAVVSTRPFNDGDTGMGFGAPGQSEATRDVPWASWRLVSADFFRTLDVGFVGGRTFLPEEEANPRDDSPVVVSRRLAETLYPGQNAVGRPLIMWKGQGNKPATIVGVVEDIRERGLDTEPPPVVYLPASRMDFRRWEFVVHTAGAPMASLPGFRTLLANHNPGLLLFDPATMQDIVVNSVASRRFYTVMLTVFASLALLLAVAGVYGVLSYWIDGRTAEIGLRMALGADVSQILQVTLNQGMRPVLAGIALGLAGAAALSRYLETLLFEIKAAEPATYAAVAIVVSLVSLAACSLPALRAARIHPAEALRRE